MTTFPMRIDLINRNYEQETPLDHINILRDNNVAPTAGD